MLRDITNLFIEQIEERLRSIYNRGELEKELFEVDMEEFIKDASNVLSLELRKRFDTTELEREKFDDFFKNEAESIIKEIYDKKIKDKNSKIIKLWNDELTLFSNELTTIQYVFKNIASEIKVNDIKLSSKANLLKSIDNSSSAILKLTGKCLALVGIGGGITVFKTGVSSITKLAASAMSVIISPVGIAIAGSIGTILSASFIFNRFFDDNKVKAISIMQASMEVENKLKSICTDEIEKFHKFLDDEVVNQFYRIAEKKFDPILRDIYFILYEDKKHNELNSHP